MSIFQIPLAVDTSATQPRNILAGISAFQQVAEQQKKLAGQNMLAKVFSNPASFDAQGNVTPQALQAVGAVSPDAYIELKKAQADEMVQRWHAEQLKDEATAVQAGVVTGSAAAATNARKAALQSGLSPADADAAAVKARNEYLDLNGGILPPDKLNAAKASKFDPVGSESLARLDKDYIASEREQSQAKAVEDRAKAEERRLDQGDRRLEAIAARAGASEGTKGWSIQDVTVNGKTTPMRVNAVTGEVKPLELPEGAEIKKPGSSGAATATLNDEDADRIAGQYLAGDKSAVAGLGYGNAGAANRAKAQSAITAKMKAQGRSPEDVAAKIAEYQGVTSEERALGTRTATMEIAANEVKNMAPLALEASKKVSRTDYPLLNKIIIAAEEGTGDPEVVRFGLATNSLIYTYAKFLNPTGIPTDADKARTADILSRAWADGQFDAAVDQIQKEIKSGRQAISTTKADAAASVAGKPSTAEKPAAAEKPKRYVYDPATGEFNEQ